MVNSEVDLTWISNHYDGILDTEGALFTDDIDTETGVTLQTEAGVDLERENQSKATIEIFTIPFVGNSSIETEADLIA